MLSVAPVRPAFIARLACERSVSRTVLASPAAIEYDFEPYTALPRASRSVPRQTAPASPSQTTRTPTRPLRSTRRLRLDLIFALARLDLAWAPATLPCVCS